MSNPDRTEIDAPSTAVSVHITVRVGDLVKEFDAVAATDTPGFTVADGMLSGLRETARDWLFEAKGLL